MGMDVYIKKYFWLLGPIVVIICSALAATAVAHVVEAVALTDSDKPVHHAIVRPPPPQPSPTGEPAREPKSGDAMALRNMFCSACQPAEPAPADTATTDTGGGPPITALPLRLLATSVAADDRSSFCTVLNTQTNVGGAYWVGSQIPNGGKVVKVMGRFVDFQNDATRRVERMSLLGGAEAPPPVAVAAADVGPNADEMGPKDDFLAAVDAGVKKVDDTTYEIDRSLVDKVLANPTAVAKGARVVPSVKNGQPNGFKLYAIRPTSVYAKIGLMNGDTINAVNGFDLTSMDKALEVYTKVKENSSLSVSITRRGKPMTINYGIK